MDACTTYVHSRSRSRNNDLSSEIRSPSQWLAVKEDSHLSGKADNNGFLSAVCSCLCAMHSTRTHTCFSYQIIISNQGNRRTTHCPGHICVSYFCNSPFLLFVSEYICLSVHLLVCVCHRKSVSWNTVKHTKIDSDPAVEPNPFYVKANYL